MSSATVTMGNATMTLSEFGRKVDQVVAEVERVNRARVTAPMMRHYDVDEMVRDGKKAHDQQQRRQQQQQRTTTTAPPPSSTTTTTAPPDDAHVLHWHDGGHIAIPKGYRVYAT